MMKQLGKIKNFFLLILLISMVGLVIFILINRAKNSDLVYRNSTYYKQENGNYN